MTDIPMAGARQVPLDEPLHMPSRSGTNLCDGEPYVTRLLHVDSDTMQTITYPMCPTCWTLLMAGAEVGHPFEYPQPVDIAAVPPKEIEDAPAYTQTVEYLHGLGPLGEGILDKADIVRATAERLDRPDDRGDDRGA